MNTFKATRSNGTSFLFEAFDYTDAIKFCHLYDNPQDTYTIEQVTK